MPRTKHTHTHTHTHSGSKHKHRHSEVMSNPVYSYHQGEHMLHYYRWTSPPGVMKILGIIIIILCVAVFACVASTLAWEYEMSIMGGGANLIPGYGGGAYGGSYSGSYGSSYGGGSGGYGTGSAGGSYGYGYGGTQVDPKAGKGFMIAISAITFIAVLIIFVIVISRQSTSRTPQFYLAAIIISAILAFLMIIGTIVYVVAVNPMAQSSGSMMYNQVYQMCAQYQTQTQTQGIFLNQYLYHYCVVDPQEAVAIVLGFLIFIGLILLLVFAVRTRSQMRYWGVDRVLWEEPKVASAGFHNSIGEWINNVSEEPQVLVNAPNDRVGGFSDHLDQMDYKKPLYLPGDSDISSSVEGLKSRLKDYDPGMDSGDELEDEDFSVLFPKILDEHERLTYKREFDRDHLEYKNLQAKLEGINQDLADLERDLDRLPEGSPQFLDAMSEHTRLRNLKKNPQYQMKKRRCRFLRSKLSHIKKQISEYDSRP